MLSKTLTMPKKQMRNKKMNKKQIDFTKFEVDEEQQSIIFSCCSDAPYTRYEDGIKYDEILVINKESVDLSRLNNSASVLFNHDPDQLLGVVDKAFIANNKVFVTCRFSTNDEKSIRIYKDIIDGLIKNVSIGYQILDYEDIRDGETLKRYVTKWMIYEVSIVSIPADTTCGIRQLAVTAEEPAEEEKELDDATKDEIKQIGKDFNIAEEKIKNAINKKLTIREFKQTIFNNKKENKNMNRSELASYIQSRNFDQPFTLRDFSGFAPAPLVSSTTLTLCEALKKKMGLSGFRTLSGLTSNVTIPVQTGRPVVTAPGINEASTDSNPEFKTVTLTPQKFVASVLIGKEMLVNSNSDVEAFIVDAILSELGYKIEGMMLEKIAAAAETEVNFASLSAVTWQNILAMEAGVNSYNLADKKFVMTPAAIAAMKGNLKGDNSAARFLMEDGKINGYEVCATGCANNDNIVFGDMSQLVLGNWTDMDICIDPFSHAREGACLIVGSACVDAAVLNGGAFAVGKIQ